MLYIELPERKFRLSWGVTLTETEAHRELTRLITDYTKNVARWEWWKSHGTYSDGKLEGAYLEMFATYRKIRELSRLATVGN